MALSKLAPVVLLFGVSTASCDRAHDLIEPEARTEEEPSSRNARPKKGAKPGLPPHPSLRAPDPQVPPRSTSSAPNAPPPNPWDVAWVPARLRSTNGKAGRLSKLIVYGRTSLGHQMPARVIVELQSPEKALDFDKLTFAERELTSREPVKLHGEPPSPDALARIGWDEDDLDFAAIAKMVEDAPMRAGLSDGKVSHVLCERPIPFSCELQCRVMVTGERRDAVVDYDGKGAPWKESFPWISNKNPCRDLHKPL